MRNLLAATVATLCLFGSSICTAQAPLPYGANASKFGIAVIDIGYIFKEHAAFRAQMDAMKKEMETIEEQLKSERAQIEQKEKQQQTFQPGSTEFRQLDEEVTRMKADFNVRMTQLRKDFLDREAKTYFQTYTQVQEVVTQYCQRNNIALVLRFNGEPADPHRRENVLQEINKPIVYQNQIDITGDVLALLNRNAPVESAQPGTARPGAAQPGSGTPPAVGARPTTGVAPR